MYRCSQFGTVSTVTVQINIIVSSASELSFQWEIWPLTSRVWPRVETQALILQYYIVVVLVMIYKASIQKWYTKPAVCRSKSSATDNLSLFLRLVCSLDLWTCGSGGFGLWPIMGTLIHVREREWRCQRPLFHPACIHRPYHGLKFTCSNRGLLMQ